MKLLKKIFSESNRNLFYQTNPEAHAQAEMPLTGVDRVQNLLDQTEKSREQSRISTESAEDRIKFAEETLKAEQGHYEEALKLSPEDSKSIDQDLDHELLAAKEKEAQEVGRLNQETRAQFDTLITDPIDTLTGIKPAGWESKETPGSAEAVIDVTNPNPNISDSFLKQGDVSEELSHMNA